MKETYAEQYRKLYHEHWWWRARESILLKVLNGLFQDHTNLKILDVGCGDGLFFSKLSNFGEVFGVEPDLRLVSPNNLNNSNIHKGNFDHTYNPSISFDLILLLDVIEHIEDDLSVLRKASESLTPSGKLIITVPALMHLWTRHDDKNLHHRRYNRTMLNERIKKAGLDLLSIQYLFHWPGIIKWILHYIEKLFPEREETHIPPKFINRILQFITEMEYKLTAPLGIPFGSSLLAVATRQNNSISKSY